MGDGSIATSVVVVVVGSASVSVEFGTNATVSVRYSVKAEGHEYIVSVVIAAEGRCAKASEEKPAVMRIEGFMAIVATET